MPTFHLISDCLRPLHGRPLPDGLNTIRQFLLAAPLALASVFSSLFIPAAHAQSCETLRSAHGEDVISVHCGGAPSATFDHNNHLWVAFVSNKHVYVSRSEDKGTTFSTPVQVNALPEDAEFNGENRPKIIVANNGTVLLSWTTKTSNRFTGEIRFSRSTDGGRSFEQPHTVNDDGLAIGHRFDSLFLTESGKLYVTWIDKRDLEASLARSEDYPGAAIYYTVSEDLGASFMPNVRVSHNSCECCRIAVAPHGDDNIAILWRQIFGEQIRDHAIAVLSPDGMVSDLSRATIDDWQIDACPHHG
ncbi:MAG: sialidase family protein, partial [Pseudohongiella sp.]|nr:sialidase family protein [Pseudohongiella sp.]